MTLLEINTVDLLTTQVRELGSCKPSFSSSRSTALTGSISTGSIPSAGRSIVNRVLPPTNLPSGTLSTSSRQLLHQRVCSSHQRCRPIKLSLMLVRYSKRESLRCSCPKARQLEYKSKSSLHKIRKTLKWYFSQDIIGEHSIAPKITRANAASAK